MTMNQDAVVRRRPFPATIAPLDRLRQSRARAVVTRLTAVDSPLIPFALWGMTILFASFMLYLGWARYDHFLPHAEDLGNMEQAAWHTAHGSLFAFNNQRHESGIEATGTTTRLSIHVEPIWFLLVIPYLVASSPIILLTIQAVVVATGVFPAALLAKRHLKLALAQIVFPLAYVLAPPLQAATLYEFHPVTLSAGFLLWALYFADGRQYKRFVLFAVLAAATKEEIGLIVGFMGLWIAVRNRDYAVGLSTTVLAIGWSVFASVVVLRYFSPHGHGSPFCGRFNPYKINGQYSGPEASASTCSAVAKIWLQHPDQVLSVVWITQKIGFLHRMLMTTGYLALLGPLVLAISLPSYALILFSNDVHMYSGLGHYPAELVPLLIGSAILGVAFMANRVAPWVSTRLPGKKLTIAPAVVTSVACLWLLVGSFANTNANGFTPLSTNYLFPQETAHDRIAEHLISLIPPDASVSAGDYLNAHLSDRRNIFLFPDDRDANYIALDASRDHFPYGAADERTFIQRDITPGGGAWGVVFASDGLLLLERLSLNPRLPQTLPPAFFTFIAPDPQPPVSTLPNAMHVNFGPSLQLLGYSLERREDVNLRLPDILMTTYWRLSSPVTEPITPVLYLTNGLGAIDIVGKDNPSIDWMPVTQWPVGKIITTQSSLTIFSNDNGKVDVDLAVYKPETCRSYPAGQCDLLTDEIHHYHPDTRSTSTGQPLEVVASGTILKLTQVPVQW